MNSERNDICNADDYAIGAVINSDIAEQEANIAITDELESFRQQWKHEVASKNKQIAENSKYRESVGVDDVKLSKARQHFLDGIESERNGQMNNALKSYRVAIQLDPDIEQHMSNMQDFEQQASDDEPEHELSNSFSMIEKFNNLHLSTVSQNQHQNPMFIGRNLNITQLPSEVLSYVCHWVASAHMDMKSIEALSETCRKLYVHARDSALWKAACERIWGLSKLQKGYVDWRRMYIERPHVHLDGVYICKVSYFRQGDPTVLSSNYQPFQCVEYFRYLRFFENNRMLLYTTPDEPSMVIPRLSLENATQLQFRTGHYKCHSERQEKYKSVTVTGILIDRCGEKHTRQYHKRTKKSEMKYVLKETEYFVDLQLTSSSTRRRFNKLSWLKYSCRFKYSDEHSSPVTEIDLREQYPPFYFSRVKSYNKRAHNVL